MFFHRLNRMLPEMTLKTSHLSHENAFGRHGGRIYTRTFFSEKIGQWMKKAFAANIQSNYLWDSHMSRISIKPSMDKQKKTFCVPRTITTPKGAIEFKSLLEVDKSEVIALLNNPLVRRHMPLAKELIDETGYASFISAKEEIWSKNGYGPWACFLDTKFIGWAGFQPEQEDVEIALVLHPDHWGNGRYIYKELFRQGFEELGFSSIIVLFPPSRKNIRGLFLLGFERDGEVFYDDEKFLRFRLNRVRYK